MQLKTYHPQLAELMNEIDKIPVIPTLRTFGEIVNSMRNTHDVLMVARGKFENIYSEAVKSGKYTTAGLRDMKEDFETAYRSITTKFEDLILSEIEKWKSLEQKNTYAQRTFLIIMLVLVHSVILQRKKALWSIIQTSRM